MADSDEGWHQGACDNCSTDPVLVKTSKDYDRSWDLCQVCRNLIRMREDVSVNLAVCTNMILKAIREQSIIKGGF